MTPSAVRVGVIVVCAGGIAGMIVASVTDNNAIVLTFGLITAAAVACLIVATAVTNAPPVRNDEDVERVEAMVHALVDAGADETAVARCVREVVHLDEARLGARLPGRGARRTHP